jgi:hypothetical protein
MGISCLRTGPGWVIVARRGAGRGQQTLEGGAARLAQLLADRDRNGEFVAPDEALQELGHERMEPMGANAAGCLPPHRGGRGDLGPVLARPAAGPRRRPGPRCPAQQPDGRLAMNPRDGHDLIQQPPFLAAGRLQVPHSLDGGVLPKARSRHGHLPAGIGNRDF